MDNCIVNLFQSQAGITGGLTNTSFLTTPTNITESNATEFFRYDHTPISFKGGACLGANFEYSTAIVFDIDNSHSDTPEAWEYPNEMVSRLKEFGFNYLIVASRNHLLSKDGKTPRPKFHVYLPLSVPLCDSDKFVSYCKWCIETFAADPKVKSKGQKLFGYGDNPNAFIEHWSEGRYIDEVLTDDDLCATEPASHIIPSVNSSKESNRDFDWFCQSGEWLKHISDLEALGWEFFEKNGRIFFQTPLGDHEPGKQDGNIMAGVAFFFSMAPDPFENHKGYSICQLYAGILFRDIGSEGLAMFAKQYFQNNIPQRRGKPSKNKIQPILIRVSDVEEKEIQWLWENKIPLGMLSLISGLAGVGKSFLTVYMAAVITNGRDWPDGKPCERGSVLFFYGEEGIEDTYKKRFRANGADQSKIVFMDDAELLNDDKECSEIAVTLAMIDVIEEAIKGTAKKTGLPVKMVIVDPIANYWGGIKENSNAEVRSVLKPLQHLAEKTGVAFVVIQHEGKAEKEHVQQRVLGSTGIVAACRSVWGVFVDPDDENNRIFAKVKANCGYGHTAVSYRITPPDGTVEIIKASIENLTGDDISNAQRRANAKKRGPKSDKLGDCMKQIEEILKDGDRLAEEIKEILFSKGFGKSTIQEAKMKLGVISVRDGAGRLWHWSPGPENENCGQY